MVTTRTAQDIQKQREEETLPEGPYGIELGYLNLKTGQICWGLAKIALFTDEYSAVVLARALRQENIEAARGFINSNVMEDSRLTPENMANFYRPFKSENFYRAPK